MSKIKIAKCSEATVKKYLKKAKLSTEGTLDELVMRLVEHEKASGSTLVECDVCGGLSQEDHPECPFCGSAETEEEPAKEPKPTKPAKEPKPTKPAKEPTARGVKVADDSAHKPTKKQLAEPTEKPTPKLPSLRTPVETAETKKTVAATEKMLDKAIEKIQKAQREGATALYTIGETLLDIEQRGLYTLRTNADGSPKYRSMSSFCEDELGVSKAYAQRLADISRRFTREDVAQIGPTKLGILIGVKEGATSERLLEAARSGVSVSSLADEVKNLPDDERAGPRRPGRFGGGAVDQTVGNKARERAKVNVEPSEELVTYITEPTAAAPLLLNDKPTKKADGAMARILSANGIIQTIRVEANEEGLLSLRITFER